MVVGISAGIVPPLKDEIISYNNDTPISQSEKVGYYVTIGFPYRGGIIDLGFNSIGYDQQQQFMFGFTTFFK